VRGYTLGVGDLFRKVAEPPGSMRGVKRKTFSIFNCHFSFVMEGETGLLLFLVYNRDFAP
jgi:hypothetical protein